MKYILCFLLAASIKEINAQQHKLQKLWESDTTLAVPESVLPDTKKNILYVSLIDGAPWAKDGKGAIGILDVNGKIVNTEWATGLHAPKGMAIVGNKLYVADVTDVVIINTANGKVEQKIAIDSSETLNDVTADKKGNVYISDSKRGQVFLLTKNNKASLYLSGLAGINGLKAMEEDLYILTRKEVYKADAKKNLTKISELELGGDGLEPVGNGDFIASSWIGTVYYIDKAGKTDLLLDTREQKKNTADIGYDPQKRIVYIPTFFAKSVAAYQLQ